MTKLVAALISSTCDSIFNPFAGTLSYATGITHYTKFDAIELNPVMWELGAIRAALSEFDGMISLKQGDVANWPSNKYDAIVMDPPSYGRSGYPLPDNSHRNYPWYSPSEIQC